MIAHAGYLNHGLHGINYASWQSCIVCSGDGPGDCYTNDHKYTPFGYCVEYDDDDGEVYYIHEYHEVTLPVKDFYWLDDNDGSKSVPLDCRSCANYQSSKCIPLRNAIDDMDGLLHNIKDPKEHQQGYQISPCSNWEPTFHMAFHHDADAHDFISAFKCYYGLTINSKINLGRDVTGKHYFEDVPSDDIYGLVQQPMIGTQ